MRRFYRLLTALLLVLLLLSACGRPSKSIDEEYDDLLVRYDDLSEKYSKVLDKYEDILPQLYDHYVTLWDYFETHSAPRDVSVALDAMDALFNQLGM